jgi:voltage-gated potassium channel
MAFSPTPPDESRQSKKRPRGLPTRLSGDRRIWDPLSGHPFLVVIGLVGVFLVLGTIGYVIIEGWTALDALYMTVITMTTIGFGEIEPLSSRGRIFTIGLIVSGVVIASYAVTMTVELIVSQGFLEQIRHRRRRRILNSVTDHCIICGFGRLGRNLAHELTVRKWPVIVVDIRSEVIQECEPLGIPAIIGSAADERILEEAGISRARSLVAAVKSDAENVFIVLTATSMNPNLQIISRCNFEPSIPKLEKAGATTVISPYVLAGRRIAQMITHPNVLSFLDGILEFGDHQMRLEEFIIGQNSPVAGMSLKEAKLKVAILAVTYPGQTLLSHPNAETRLEPGAAVIAMGIDQELTKFARLVKGG